MPYLRMLDPQVIGWFAMGSSFALMAAVVAGLVHF